jgi:hypothetical protein
METIAAGWALSWHQELVLMLEILPTLKFKVWGKAVSGWGNHDRRHQLE